MRHNDLDSFRLLVIHGSAIVRASLAQAAHGTHCFRTVRHMANARFALEYLVEALQTASPTTPDMVVLDLELPGLNGVQFTRELRRHDRRREILVVFLASSAAPRQQDAAETAGADYFLRRPDSPEAVAKILSALATRITTYREHAQLETQLARTRFACALLTDHVV